jgi:integrase
MAGSILSYCSCRDPQTGRRYRKGECPKPPRHKRWLFKIDQGKVYDPATGGWKRDQVTKHGFETKRDAERALEALIPAIRAGTAPSPADRQITVAQFLDHWLRHDPDLRPSTRASYTADVTNYLRPGLGHLRLAEVRPDDITGLFARMASGQLRPVMSRGRDVASVAAINRAYRTLHTAMAQAVAEQRITRNPCGPVKVARPRRKPVKVWDPEQTARFLGHARVAEPDLAPAFQLSAWRGLRRGEVAGLKWDDIDLDAGLLTVRRNVTEAGRQVHEGEPKTERGVRTVSLGPKLVAVLREHRRAQAARRLAAERWADEGWAFPGDHGQVITPHTLTHRFKALVRECPDLPDLHYHGLRHTAATQMLLAGVAPKVVQDQLGHATLAMTMDLYGHVVPAQRDASAEALEALYS